LSHPYKKLGSIAVSFINDMINEKPIGKDKNISLRMSIVERQSCKRL
jgi:DNA-binding LacI/PurR family transcriptional regulator